MKNSTFAFHNSFLSQRKFNSRDILASEGRPVSQICVIDLSPGSALSSIIVGERIFCIRSGLAVEYT
jgi:hypothetical protein